MTVCRSHLCWIALVVHLIAPSFTHSGTESRVSDIIECPMGVQTARKLGSSKQYVPSQQVSPSYTLHCASAAPCECVSSMNDWINYLSDIAWVVHFLRGCRSSETKANQCADHTTSHSRSRPDMREHYGLHGWL